MDMETPILEDSQLIVTLGCLRYSSFQTLSAKAPNRPLIRGGIRNDDKQNSPKGQPWFPRKKAPLDREVMGV